jgi:asparagine N-glycosylation enzyme membrane subunit Stt3
MPEVLPSRPRSKRTYAAVALFLVVYVGVLAVVFAPRDMIAVQSGAAFYGADN